MNLDINKLYQLSLSLDSSVEMSKNAATLVKALFSQEEIQQVSVWIKNEDPISGKTHYTKIDDLPRAATSVNKLDADHPLFNTTKHADVYFVSSESKAFEKVNVFNNFSPGTLFIYDLKDIGIVELFTSCLIDEDYSAPELDRIIDKFRSCLENNIELGLMKKESDYTKEAVQTFKENEEIFSDFIENANDLIQTVDANGKVIYANNAWLKTLEYEKNELKNLSLIDIIRPDLIPKCFSIFQKLLSGEIIEKMETVFVSKTGKEIMVEGSINCRYKEGKPIHTRGIFRDITENKKSESALKHSEERYRQLVERANDIIYRCDYQGYFKYANPVALRITGYSFDEVTQMHFTDFVREDQREIVKEFYREQFLNNISSTYLEFPIISKAGKEIWLGQNVQALSEGGYIMGFQALARDITKTKKIKEELEKAKIVAEESTKTKEQFLANMSHEIRTPINGIMGMTYLLKETPTSDNQRKFLNAIESSSKNLLVIIDDILDISKIESGKMTFEKVGFRVSETIDTLKNSLEIKALEKGIKLGYNIDIGLYQILIGDPVRLNQILTNLVSNAIKFTESGSVYINTKLLASDEDHKKILFEVVDTGIGIPKEKQPLIFESFKQADDSITRRFGGTGLGLTICKTLVEGQGGEISVESEEGKGSTFRFWIEYKIGQDTDIAKVKQDEDKKTQQKAQLGGMKVLLVEDNEYNQLFAKNTLLKWDIVVDVAENGKVAVEKLMKNPYDIVLMDVQMPIMDGIEATQKIRNKLKSDVPIIAMTANAIKGDNEKCIDAGMDDYISKPFMPEDLLEKLNHYVKQANVDKSKQRRISVEKNKQSEKVTDIDNLMMMCSNDPEFALQMINSLQEHIPNSLNEMEKLAKEENWVKLGMMVHKIKPSLELVGIHLTKDMVMLEQYGKREEHTEKIPKLTEELVKLCKKAIKELTAEAEKLRVSEAS